MARDVKKFVGASTIYNASTEKTSDCCLVSLLVLVVNGAAIVLAPKGSF
jgi:hypothetical protein